MTDRQKEILNAALALIGEGGIQELTMKRIAAAIGVSEPALYRHFASKSEILSAIVDEMEATKTEALVAARRANRGTEETFISFFESQARQFLHQPSMATVFFSEDSFRSDSRLLSRVAGIISETRQAIQQDVDAARQAGFFRQDVDSEIVALMLLGGFRLLVSTWRMENQAFDLPARASAYIRSVLSLMK